ncbi:UNC-like C-terminal-domain-containing protein [Parasitella parasitica]|nr:UNC-like C-terminal-domain-containing protein [Parasitella parasitica]
MSSPYRSTHSFSPVPSPRDRLPQHTESLGTSVNIATAFSASRSSGYSQLNRSSEEEADYLDINKIDHEAIKNDPELRELSRNPSAFNNTPSLDNYYSRKHTNLPDYKDDDNDDEDDGGGDDDDDDDDFGVFKEVELLVRNPLEEKRQRQLVSQISNLSSVQNVPTSPKRKHNSFLWSASTVFDFQEGDKSMEKAIADSVALQDGEHHNFYLILKPVVFILFMVFWIIKEPIIRTITFITMIVSTVVVDPLFYLWSRMPTNNRKKRIPGTDIRRRFTHWCTASLLVVLMILATKYHYPGRSAIPAWAATIRSNIQSSMPSVSTPASMNGLDRQHLKLINNEYQLLASRLDKFHSQFAEFTKGVDNKYAKLGADANNEYSKLWTAINNQQTQINALHDKLDSSLRKLFSAKQHRQLPDSILIPTDKDNRFELPASFYEHLHNADSWDQFLKQNKAAIDRYLEGQMDHFFQRQEKNGAIVSKDAFLSLITNDLVKRLKGKKGDPTETLSLSQLVASAVEKYHQDMLDSADFALASRGGHIIFSKTSPTYESVSPWIQRLRKAAGLAVIAHPPELAIRPETHVGECWSMAGHSGRLGVLLSEPIMIQSVTIEHPSKNILLQHIDSAPKDIEIYGIRDYGNYGHKEELVSLGRVYYDINNSAKPVQTFTVNSNPTESYRAVLFKIKSNWGNSDHTDLYRVRVHGVPL